MDGGSEGWDEIDESGGGGEYFGGGDDYLDLYVCTGCTHLYR